MEIPPHKTRTKKPFLIFGFFLIACSLGTQAAPIISEFVADNETGLRDPDGEFEDWLELYNPDPDPIELGGYFLTDNPLNLQKWAIPAGTVLEPGAFLVIFASGKDRAVAGEPLHTSFALSNAGEYLALLGPDGTTIIQEFPPTFPVQFNDASYGFEQTPITEEEILVDVDAACTTHVPSDGTLGSSWTQASFDDSLWSAGTLGVGYERGDGFQALINHDVEAAAFNTSSSVYLRIPFTLDRIDDIIALSLDIQYDDGFAAYLNGIRILGANAPGNPTWNSLAPLDRDDADALDFQAFSLNGHLTRLQIGQNVFSIHIMNSAANDDDLLARLQLSAIRLTDLTIGDLAYFSTPTPGARNGTQEELPASEVIFSHPHQTFIDPFRITLSSTFPGETIRYTTNRTVPNASSTEYTGSISIANSMQIRARVFGADGAAGPVKMRSYLKLNDLKAQSFSSNLPIVILENWGRGAPGGSTNLDSFWAIIEPDPVSGRARMISEFQIGTRAGIRRRGSSSFNWPKYSMTLEAQDEDGLDKGIKPLGMPRESDWILSGRYQFDKALMRNDLIYELSRQTGEYAVRTRFVEVFNNTGGGPLAYSGDYFGVYSLMEKIKRDDNRVPVARIDRRDSREPDVTGGYVFKKDRLDPGDGGFSVSGMGTLGWVEPKEREVTSTQRNWLQRHLNELNAALGRPDGINTATRKHFTDYIDQDSWLRHHWLNILAMNVDGFRLSGYYYKHRTDTNGGKIGAGPIWDFDRTMGSTDSRDNNPSQWNGSGDSSRTWNDGRYPWWGQALAFPDFRQAHTDLWQELRRTTFSTANINSVIDGFAAQLGERDGVGDNASGVGRSPAERNFAKWPSANLRLEVRTLQTWLRTRVSWIDRQYTQAPAISSANGLVEPGLALLGEEFAFLGSGDIYYTTDGSDPRVSGGQPSSSAIRVSANTAIPITETTTITARARVGTGLTSWSGPMRGSFLIGPLADASNLIISEVHYAPLPASTPAELAVATDPSNFEFLEMKNISATETLNLTDVHFAQGLEWTFTRSDITSLAPGEFVLIVCNKAAFEARYGTAHSARIAGEFAPTRLDNAGERIHLLDGLGNTIADFQYNDKAPWPEPAGIDGFSLVLRSAALPQPDYTLPGNWAISSDLGGTPNADEIITGFAGDPIADDDQDGYPRLLEYLLGTSDSNPHDTAGTISSSIQSLDANGITQNFLTMSVRRSNDAQDVVLIPQFSVDLVHWFSGEQFVPLISEIDQGDGTSIVTYRAFVPQQASFPTAFMRLGADLLPTPE